MVTGHVFIATSLDGFVARMDHSIDWLVKQKTEGQDLGYEDFIASVDGLIMGRGSFKNILTFGDWPYQKPVFVMSKSLTQNDVPQALTESVRVTQLDPQELMESLTKDGWTRVYVDGGQVVQSFIRAGLIEDMTITLIPILIGKGAGCSVRLMVILIWNYSGRMLSNQVLFKIATDSPAATMEGKDNSIFKTIHISDMLHASSIRFARHSNAAQTLLTL